MIKRLGIKNYQSLQGVSLDIGKFTVIFGDSDVGKSAVYRAVRGLVTAEDGDAFITKGKPKLGVSLVVDDAEVVWIKPRGKSSTYHLYKNDEKVREWSRARSLPKELASKLRFEQLVVDNEKFFPNFRGQFDPLFMLFESSGKRARLLGSLVSNLLLRGIKIANVERNRAEADIRAMSGLAETLEKKLEVDWNTLETKAVAATKFASVIEKQVNTLIQVEILSRERDIVKDGVELERDLIRDIPKALYEIDEWLSKAELWRDVTQLFNEKCRFSAAIETIFNVPLEEDFDKAVRMEEVFEFVCMQNEALAMLDMDIGVGVDQINSCKNAINEVDKKIKKLEVAKSVKCPYCKKEFQL